MVKIQQTKSFTRSFNKLKRKHYPVDLIKECIISILKGDENTLHKIKDHSLSGNWTGYREFHPARYSGFGKSYDNWIVIYKYDGDELILTLVSTGNHNILRG